MIPYIGLTTIPLGPLTIQVWGLLVALGVIVGCLVATWFAKRRGDNPEIVWDIAPWLLFSGIIGARIGHVLFYDWSTYAADPLAIVRIWDGGMSIMGGFMAAVLVGIWWLRQEGLDVWRYADVIAFGLPFGKWIGRIGCFLIHDHSGTATDFVLGVEHPDGVVRHDLGLYLSLNGLAMGLFMLWLSRKPRPTGTYVAVFSLWYGVARFWLDFYRVADVRVAGLTPAQYLCLPLIAFGIWTLLWIRKQT